MALAWQPATSRPALTALFAFDAHLGRLVGNANEPLLGQMRLAWWRERLSEPAADRPTGDPILAALGDHWRGAESALVRLVDGWEELLDEEAMTRDALSRFADARGRALGEFAARTGVSARQAAAERAGRRWALADFAFRTGSTLERDVALDAAQALPGTGRLPQSLRGIAVLEALADRAISRREPLAHGRAAALLALRVGTTGR